MELGVLQPDYVGVLVCDFDRKLKCMCITDLAFLKLFGAFCNGRSDRLGSFLNSRDFVGTTASDFTMGLAGRLN